MVAMREIKSAARKIARLFEPERIMLFGSYARGDAKGHSDVDLLILMKGKHVHDRALAIREAIDFEFPVDLLVRSPEEFHLRIDWGDHFLTDIRDNGVILYEATHSGMGAKSRRRLRNGAARSAGKKSAQ
jgi:uncharacterized protein